MCIRDRYMTSAADSVDNENFVVRRQGNALRVTYTMGSENALLSAAEVIYSRLLSLL